MSEDGMDLPDVAKKFIMWVVLAVVGAIGLTMIYALVLLCKVLADNIIR